MENRSTRVHGNWILDNILNKRYLLSSTKYCPFYRGMDKKKTSSGKIRLVNRSFGLQKERKRKLRLKSRDVCWRIYITLNVRGLKWIDREIREVYICLQCSMMLYTTVIAKLVFLPLDRWTLNASLEIEPNKRPNA